MRKLFDFLLCSQKEGNKMQHITAKEYQAYLAKENAKKKTKHRNRFVYIFSDNYVSSEKADAKRHGDIVATFASQKEYDRWNELKILEKAGKISHLLSQVPFLLTDPFISEDGKKHRATYYTADFTYTEDEKEIVEDVKGWDKKTGKYLTTRVFDLKWKMLQAKYPGKTFRIY